MSIDCTWLGTLTWTDGDLMAEQSFLLYFTDFCLKSTACGACAVGALTWGEIRADCLMTTFTPLGPKLSLVNLWICKVCSSI